MQLYVPQQEYRRLGITSSDVTSALADGDAFRLSHVNSNYAIAPSYPALLAVPGTATDEEVVAAAVRHMRSSYHVYYAGSIPRVMGTFLFIDGGCVSFVSVRFASLTFSALFRSIACAGACL